MKMVLKGLVLASAVLGLLAYSGCTTAPKTMAGKMNIEDDAREAMRKARTQDSTLGTFFNSAAGYAVFPSVGKGAAGVGGAYGKGVVFEGGMAVGYCDLSQVTIGAQLGGQGYTEIVAFRTPEAISIFKQGNFRFDAQATAVAVQSGAGANAKFTNGVAVFTMDETGLMFEASVGGQKFGYQAK